MKMGIGTYITKRLAMTILAIFFIISIIFFVLHVLPGDPVRVILGEKAPQWQVDAIRHQLGLDKPIHIQYVDYLAKLLQGDMGTSMFFRTPVAYEIVLAFPVTLELALFSLLTAVVVGIPLGLVGALKRNTLIDHIINFLSSVAYSIPVFMLGLILQYVIGTIVGILPITGRYTSTLQMPRITGMVTLDCILTGNLEGFVDALKHLILPSMSLSVSVAMLVCGVSRSNMIEVLSEDYIRFARAKGLSESKIVYKHAFRNAILPVLAVLGYFFAGSLGGAILVETIFSFPGMGLLLVDAMIRRDYPLIQGCIIVFALAVIAVSTIMEIFYAILDPRVRS